MRRAKYKSHRGFTLIEIMTALSIFLVVMTISMGSIVSIFDADRKSRSLREVMGNLNLAMEAMAREMRFGTNYHCGTSGELTVPQNCPSGDTLLSFLSSDSEQITYRKTGTSIEKSIDGGGYISVTAPEVVIDDLTFYALGAGTGNTLQPKVLIKVRGTAGSGDTASEFTLQTLVSQRAIDR